jgi:hypothetical protein
VELFDSGIVFPFVAIAIAQWDASRRVWNGRRCGSVSSVRAPASAVLVEKRDFLVGQRRVSAERTFPVQLFEDVA